MRYAERKPLMCKDKRKVLDLLEFCLELEPTMPSVATLFYILKREDITPWTDKEMCVILQARANDLLRDREGDISVDNTGM